MNMKLFTAIIAAGIIGSSAAYGNRATSGPASVKTRQESREFVIRKSEPSATLRKTPVKDPEIITPNIVTEQPAGEVSKWSRYASLYVMTSMGISTTFDEGCPVTIVNCGNGEVWMNNVFSRFDFPGWFKGTINADESEISFSGVQKVFHGVIPTVDPEPRDYYYMPMEFVIEDEETQQGWMYPTDQAITITKGSDGKYLQDSELILGLCTREEDGTFSWTGYGDYYAIYTPVTQECIVPPSGKEEQWACVYNEGAHPVTIVRDGEDMYIQGLYAATPEAWVKGSFSGVNFTMAPGQFLGLDTTNRYRYLFAVKSVKYSEEGFEWEDLAYEQDESIVFIYDESTQSLECVNDGVAVAGIPDPTDIPLTDWTMRGLRLWLQQPDADTPPADPTELYMEGYDTDEESLMMFSFELANVNADDDIIDPSKLYYEIFLNDSKEPFEFTAEEFFMDEPMTLIPVNFEGYYFINEYPVHVILFPMADVFSIGVRAVYKDGERELRSNLEVISDGSGVEKVMSHGEEISSESFDLLGRQVSEEMSGMRIVVKRYADGTVKATKKIQK